MGAAQQPIEIEQGSNFQMVISVVGGPDDLTGYTGAMQIRDLKSSSALLYEATSIAIAPVNRLVTVTIPFTDTVGFGWTRGNYDVLITAGDDSAAYRIAEGKVTVDHSVTREPV
jgi:hypothetical protein